MRKPVSLIVMVVKARTEGMAFNGACRTFGIAKNTLINWEMRLASLKKTLFLFALVHEFLKLIIEGDELYTKVKKNVPVEDSRGWTILLMDRASRFIWFMECGKKDKKLFKKAIDTLSKIIKEVFKYDSLNRSCNETLDIFHCKTCRYYAEPFIVIGKFSYEALKR